MNKRKARKILLAQRDKIETETNIPNHFIETLAYVDEIFGKDSVQYQLMSKVHLPNGDRDTIAFKRNYHRIISGFLDVVSNIGIKDKRNFLYRLSEGWLIFGLTFLIGGAFSVGYWVKSYEKSSVAPPVIPNNETTPKNSLDTIKSSNEIHKLDSLSK